VRATIAPDERPHWGETWRSIRQALLAAGQQRALREGDWKYLKLAGNEFLFDVVKDPRERSNLKERYQDVFERLKGDWEAWSVTMLTERPRPAAYNNPSNFLADH